MATYTEAATEQLARGRSTLQLVETIQLYNSSVGSLYYVNSPQSITATLEDGVTSVTFVPLRFQAEKPSYSSDVVPEFTLAMDGIDATFQDFAHAANASGVETICTCRVFDADNLTAPMEITPLSFTVGTLTMTPLQAKIKAVFLNLKTKRVPTLKYNHARFPSLS